MIDFLDGTSLAPFDHPYNTTALNERAVELRMALEFLVMRHNWENRLGRTLEVGNVLSHYDLSPGGRIVDRFEVAPGVENIDVFDIEGTYDTIVSISTIEHVGVDDGGGDPYLAIGALDRLRSLLAPGGRFFCTFPTGWNVVLDANLHHGFLTRDSLSSHYFIRHNGDWLETVDTFPLAYGVTQPWAEAVWVGEFGPL